MFQGSRKVGGGGGSTPPAGPVYVRGEGQPPKPHKSYHSTIMEFTIAEWNQNCREAPADLYNILKYQKEPSNAYLGRANTLLGHTGIQKSMKRMTLLTLRSDRFRLSGSLYISFLYQSIAYGLLYMNLQTVFLGRVLDTNNL